MNALRHYFREKPARLGYALALLALTGLALYGFFSLAFQAEMFARIVADPDHRMQRADKHFNGLNSDNIRSPVEADAISPDDFNIVFLGDSFVYGFLLSPEQSPPAQLQDILRERYPDQRINVINFGWTSSSPLLSYRLLQDLGAKYHPDLVLLALDMSDYRDEWFYRSIIEERGFYRYVKRFPRSSFYLKQLLEQLEPWLDWHQQLFGYPGGGGYFVARQPLEASRHLFDDVYRSLLDLDRYSRETLGAPFMVLIPPRHWQYTTREAPQSWENGGFDPLGPYALENFRYFAEKQASTPFPLVSLLEDFRQTDRYPLNFAKDSHWNKHGARFFAERVAEQVAPAVPAR